MKQSFNRPTHSSRRGFSLIETVISLTIVSVLFLGLSSAVMIGSYAIPSTSESGTADRAVVDGLNMLRADLLQAASFRHRSTASGMQLVITPKVAKAAGQPTEIRYTFEKTGNTFTRTTDLAGEQLLFGSVSDIVASFTTEDVNATSAYMLISIKGTIQPIFEVNLVLPNKPEMT
ncbi:MAG: prepilin-type N-terminal cleavage/methylation domain-containing protein [Phycisphaerales bacterium]|nr:prepilin-type N-terminal cleavage/methylation domain-containing protein [Phycisphaerales bacterium]